MQKCEHPFPSMYRLFKTHVAAFSKLIQNNCCCTGRANKKDFKINNCYVDEVDKLLGVYLVFKQKCTIWQHFSEITCLSVRTEFSLLNSRELQSRISNAGRSKGKVQQSQQHTLIIRTINYGNNIFCYAVLLIPLKIQGLRSLLLAE